MDITKHISRRKECPLCLSENLSEGIEPHVNLQYPILPVCVNSPLKEDNFVPFTIGMCNNCGLLQLKDIVDPEILYEIFHSDGIGKVWEGHYTTFSNLIKKYCPAGKVLEIGGGQGKLISKLIQNPLIKAEVIDPLYEGPTENITVHKRLLGTNDDDGLTKIFNAVVSSHCLEHFIRFNEYFKSAHRVLKKGGFLITSIPNQELGFLRGYGNQLNFEHPSVCTNAHWLALHYQNGFMIKELSFFQDHSVQIVAQKIDSVPNFKINVKELSMKILDQYLRSIQERIEKVKKFATEDKENWIFGASNFTQPLFVYGLEESYFKGVLDNSQLKHNKRLYGTTLICKKPEEILIHDGKRKRVFLNLGYYNNEVLEQIKNINSEVECILL